VEAHWDLVEQHGVDNLKENERMGMNSQAESWNVQVTESSGEMCL
jgi:hypothetical protein